MEMNDRELRVEVARTADELEAARAMMREAAEALYFRRGSETEAVFQRHREEVDRLRDEHDCLVEELEWRGGSSAA